MVARMRQFTHLIREKLSHLETRLDSQIFMRIHHSTVVNFDRVKSLHPFFNGCRLIILKDGHKFNLSRAYYEKLPPFSSQQLLREMLDYSSILFFLRCC